MIDTEENAIWVVFFFVDEQHNGEHPLNYEINQKQFVFKMAYSLPIIICFRSIIGPGAAFHHRRIDIIDQQLDFQSLLFSFQ